MPSFFLSFVCIPLFLVVIKGCDNAKNSFIVK